MLSSWTLSPVGTGEQSDMREKKVRSCFTKLIGVAKGKKVCKWERKGKQGDQSGLCNGPGKGGMTSVH